MKKTRTPTDSKWCWRAAACEAPRHNQQRRKKLSWLKISRQCEIGSSYFPPVSVYNWGGFRAGVGELLEKVFLINSLNFDLGAVLEELLEMLLAAYIDSVRKKLGSWIHHEPYDFLLLILIGKQ
jgi:hypothetical protein